MESRGPKVTGKVQERNFSGPTFAILDPSRRFYNNTDWSKDGMGAVLRQTYV